MGEPALNLPIEEPLQVPIKKAATLLGVCRQTLYRMKADNEIIFGRMRGKVMVPSAEIRRLRPDLPPGALIATKKKPAPKPMIYFVDCGEYTKIGFTSRGHEARMRGIATDNPFELRVWGTLPGDTALERELHQLFKKYHHRGEWFRLDANARSLAHQKIKSLGGKTRYRFGGGNGKSA